MESFSVAGSQLAMGASLGNSAVWIQTKGDGAIERIFLNSIGQSLVGTVNVRYAGRPEGAEPFFSGSLPEDRAPWRFIRRISAFDFKSSRLSTSPRRRSSHLRRVTQATTSRSFTSSWNSRIATAYDTTCEL